MAERPVQKHSMHQPHRPQRIKLLVIEFFIKIVSPDLGETILVLGAIYSFYTVWNPFPMISLVFVIRIKAVGSVDFINVLSLIASCLLSTVNTMYL